MTPRARWIVAIALFVVMGAAVLVPGDDEWERTASSYGAIPLGYGALHDLLVELQLSQGRSFSEGLGLAPAATVWWIAPFGLCDGVEDGDLAGAESGIWHSLDWIERGGTAVVFLPEGRQACLASIRVGEAALPVRTVDRVSKNDADESEDEDLETLWDRALGREAGGPITAVEGSVLERPRSLGEIPIHTFDTVGDFEVLASDEAAQAIVASHALGEGRLVLVSTSKPLTNRWLDHEEASLFAVDLAVALGAPLLDEREHGILPSPRAIPYLIESAALPALGGAVLLAVLALWWGRAPLPPRLEPDTATPPSLEAFVDGIGALYASTRDHGAVLRAYQELALSQLRRLFLLPPDTPARSVCERVLAGRSLARDDLEILLAPAEARSRAELLAGVARIDALVAEVAR